MRNRPGVRYARSDRQVRPSLHWPDPRQAAAARMCGLESVVTFSIANRLAAQMTKSKENRRRFV